jgi:hypothetical protein
MDGPQACVCACIYMHEYVYVYTYMCVYVCHLYERIQLGPKACIYIHVYMRECMYVCIFATCMKEFISAQMHVYMHVYVHVVRTHIHTYFCADSRGLLRNQAGARIWHHSVCAEQWSNTVSAASNADV